jgi:hypothetical protein
VIAICTTCVIGVNPNFVCKCRRRNEDNIKIYSVKYGTQTGVNRMVFANFVNSFRFDQLI